MLPITLLRVSKQKLVLFSLVAGAIAVSVIVIGQAGASAVPTIDQGILATLHTAPLTITGSGFSSDGQITFSNTTPSGDPATYDLDDATRFDVTSDTIIISSLPPGVVTGDVTVTVGGKTSTPAVPLHVYAYSAHDVPETPGTNDLPHSLAIAADGRLWLTTELVKDELKSLSNDATPVWFVTPIPQADGAGIYRINLFGQDFRTRLSGLADDIEISEVDGAIWFSQGGSYGYPNPTTVPPEGTPNFNTSRILRYEPTAQAFQCFNSPIDNAEVLGVLVDDARGVIWYAEGGSVFVEDGPGAAISAVRFDATLSDCDYDPYTTPSRDAICQPQTPMPPGTPVPTPEDDCHQRFLIETAEQPIVQPGQLVLDGEDPPNIWFTAFFGNAIGRLTPETGEVIYLPLPAGSEGHIVGGLPWQIDFDGQDFWVSEFVDTTVLRVRPTVENCLELDMSGENPCITEIVSNPYPGDDPDTKLLDVSVGGASHECITQPCKVWFGISIGNDNVPSNQIGFVSLDHDLEVVTLPAIGAIESKAATHIIVDIVPDSVTGDVWIAQYLQRVIGRLQLIDETFDTDNLDQDADGLTDAQEVEATLTDPLDPDSDDNGTLDGDEDQDGDGCQDKFEVGDDETKGGLRDPLYAHDYYDASVVDSASHPHAFSHTADFDGVIDLPNDYLGVSQHFSPSGAPPYDVIFDRGVTIGANHWERAAPDGVIDLPNDILGVLSQLGHNCQ